MLMSHWRLIDTGPLDPFTNMAVDEALVASFDPATSLPVLRFYGWAPPALSLGRFQNADETLDFEICSRENVPVVRRMTGGGVIYHREELTYSIICSQEQLGSGYSVKESLRRLCTFLVHGYRQIGLDAAFACDVCAGSKLGERTPFCFAGREDYDIVANGMKVGGNAQRRGRNVIFQHGSVPLSGPVDGGMKFLRTPAPEALRAATLHDLGVEVTAEAIKATFRAAFAKMLGVELVDGFFTPQELATRDELLRKYRSRSWTIEGRWPDTEPTGGT